MSTPNNVWSEPTERERVPCFNSLMLSDCVPAAVREAAEVTPAHTRGSANFGNFHPQDEQNKKKHGATAATHEHLKREHILECQETLKHVRYLPDTTKPFISTGSSSLLARVYKNHPDDQAKEKSMTLTCRSIRPLQAPEWNLHHY